MRIEWMEEAVETPAPLRAILPRVGSAAVALEGLERRCQATLLLTDDAGIAAINRAQRGIDAPTDVLSFPSTDFAPGTARDHPKRLRQALDPQTGCQDLGDIVISLPRAAEQAAWYGHGCLREAGFLFAHGLLHLMGYDHETDEQRAAMRAMEEQIMEKTGLSRALSDADIALLACAREAMGQAYAPYSKYRVGACVRAADGRTFSGCNVENASFGMTICAERNAMTTAVAQGACGIEAIAIAAEGAMPYPCGACRQFLREFATELRVIVANEDQVDVTTLAALLPNSFGPESLPGEDA